MTNLNLDDILKLAEQLTPEEQKQLIQQLNNQTQQPLVGGELRVSSLEEMMEQIFPGNKDAFNVQTMPFFWLDKPYYYRGQADNSWGLVPTIFRKKAHSISDEDHEKFLKEHFKEICEFERIIYDAFIHYKSRAYLPPPVNRENLWEVLFVAQHYGFPTRLLDWSDNFLAATYFAVAEPPFDKDGAVWCIRGHQFQIGEKHPEKDGTRLRYPPFASLPLNTWFFGKSSDDQDYFALVLPPYIENRIKNQSGIFSVHINFAEPTTFDDVVWNHEAFLKKHFQSIYLKFIITPDVKQKIKRTLEEMGINWSYLFPDLSGFGKYYEDQRKQRFESLAYRSKTR